MSYNTDLSWAHSQEPRLDTLYNKIFDSFTRHQDGTIEQVEQDIDLTITIGGGREFDLEEKIVRSNNYNSIYVEEWSCPRWGREGWITRSKCNILVWAFVEKETIRVYFINFKKLKKHFEATKLTYSEHINNTSNGSTGRIVPLKDIAHCIIWEGTA